MRVFYLNDLCVTESAAWPQALPAQGFVWVALARRDLAQHQVEVQAQLQALTGTSLVDLHVSDLLNQQLPSHYDYTAQYDVLVFRRLAQASAESTHPPLAPTVPQASGRGGPPVLRSIDTSPLGFALFDGLLLTVHPDDCAVLHQYATRLLALAGPGDPEGAEGQAPPGGPEAAEPGRNATVRFMPSSPADLMLRLVSQMVDGYLDLRRELTRQLDHWQAELLSPRTRFNNWSRLLDARMALHQLDDIGEDQRTAIQGWIEAIKSWPDSHITPEQRDVLEVRSRDVLEHIERVVHHVRRLEHSAEAAVQMHFSAQGHRTNEIMRTLTVLTAVFLPLNLMAGIFGMNFDFIPLLHAQAGFWWALGSMGLIALTLSLYFWRNRYLERSR